MSFPDSFGNFLPSLAEKRAAKKQNDKAENSDFYSVIVRLSARFYEFVQPFMG
jgi:hypothetical protein